MESTESREERIGHFTDLELSQRTTDTTASLSKLIDKHRPKDGYSATAVSPAFNFEAVIPFAEFLALHQEVSNRAGAGKIDTTCEVLISSMHPEIMKAAGKGFQIDMDILRKVIPYVEQLARSLSA
jgi:hypothetical protein